MDEKIARIRTAKEATAFARNAKRLGDLGAEIKALDRATFLQAQEDGYVTPAEIAIARALYVYEAEQAKVTGRKNYRANRTRSMLSDHGALIAAERMVINPRPSKGYEVLTEAGLGSLSFEAIIDQHPEEFSAQAIAAARARLGGVRPQVPALSILKLDSQALLLIERFKEPQNRFQWDWKPRYNDTLRIVKKALEEGRIDEIVKLVWAERDNSVSNAAQGTLGFETVNSLHQEFTALTREIAADPSPEKYQQVTDQLTELRNSGRIQKLPKLLIGRAFATLHPSLYHTLVVEEKHEQVILWFSAHTGFSSPEGNWAIKARALAKHLSAISFFEDESFERNMFPWFVFEHLAIDNTSVDIKPGHKERALHAVVDLPAIQRAVFLRHNQLQTELFKILSSQYGEDRVWTEYPTGSGGYADALVRLSDTSCFLYEIKVTLTAASAVRQAMGQLLEYAYRPTGLEPDTLFIVAEPALDSDTRQFLLRLNSEFHLKLEYLQLTLPDSESVQVFQSGITHAVQPLGKQPNLG